MANVRNPDREFCKEIRQGERTLANNACRICGLSKEAEWLQHAHIYTMSTHPQWERIGSNPIRWHNDSYVNSESNCIALCQTHHAKIDSEVGLQKVSVQYLESLKQDPNHCTALIGPIEGEWRRCKNKRQSQGNSYRCSIHANGGHEEGLVPRIWEQKKKTKKPVIKKPLIKVTSKNNKKPIIKVTDKKPIVKVTDKKPIIKVTDKKPIVKLKDKNTKNPIVTVTDKKNKKNKKRLSKISLTRQQCNKL